MGYSGSIMPLIAEFKLDMNDFKKALRENWPDVQIKELHEGDIDFGMTFRGGFQGFAGSTIQTRQIGWWANYEELAEFSIWFRNYIPTQYPLLVSSKHFYNHFLILKNSTEADVLQGLSGNRYRFEMRPFQKSPDFEDVFIEAFKDQWHDAICWETDENPLCWYLKSQQGFIEKADLLIDFDDNNLSFAVDFTVWCQRSLGTDCKLTVWKRFDTQHPVGVAIDITDDTVADVILNSLSKYLSS